MAFGSCGGPSRIPTTKYCCLANDQEQSVGRVFKTVAGLIKHNPKLAAEAKTLATTIRIDNGTIITALTNEAKTAAGANQGLSSWDELWGFTSERATRLWEELCPIPNKPSCRVISTYAGWEGESMLLWSLYLQGVGKDEHKDGQAKRIHKTLPIYLNKEARILCYWDHSPRMPWQTKEYYKAQRLSLRPNTFSRLHLNQWTSGESSFITADQWDRCVDSTLSPVIAGASLFLGVDIGIKSDNAAVVAVAWNPEGKLVVANHRVWRPLPGRPVILDDVQSYILQLSAAHRVWKLLADPYQAAQMLQYLTPRLGLDAVGKPVVEEFPQTHGSTLLMGNCLYGLIDGRNLLAYPSQELKEHAINAKAVEDPERGIRMTKKTQGKKIDLAIALAMACVAAIQCGPIGGGECFSVKVPRDSWYDEGEVNEGSAISKAFDDGSLFARKFW